jgi:hypothetical protein
MWYLHPGRVCSPADAGIAYRQSEVAQEALGYRKRTAPQAGQYAFSSFPASWRGDRHPIPRRQFLFFLSGEGAVQVGDCQVWHFGTGSVVLVEDTTGNGHVSWVVSQTDALTAVVQLSD